MLIKEHLEHHLRLTPFCAGRRMLMIGNQDSNIGPAKDLFECQEYKTLDPDGGDYQIDIQGDLSFMDEQWDTVFNLGTIEHVWDVHAAYSNAARMVKTGGYFIGHAPVENWNNHGIHITTSDAILTFFKINGFELVEHWKTDFENYGLILWHVAKKITHQTVFKRPQQVWVNGLPNRYE